MLNLKALALAAIAMFTMSFGALADVASNCSEEEQAYTTSYYSGKITAEEAYAFGLTIQNTIRNKDLDTLYSFVNDSRFDGPRRRVAFALGFDKVFSERWTNDLYREPDCSPHGWRGFNVSGNSRSYPSGADINYNYEDGKWVIKKITGLDFEDPSVSSRVNWEVDGRVLSPRCLTYPSISGDNYVSIDSHFAIDTPSPSIFRDPGLLYNAEIDSFQPVKSKYGDDTMESIVEYVESCSPLDAVTYVGSWGTTIQIDTLLLGYRLLSKVETTNCNQLAPHLDSTCQSAYLIEVTEDYTEGGGTMGPYVTYAIYGHFRLKSGESIVGPLKIFSNQNDGLDFIDDLALQNKGLPKETRLGGKLVALERSILESELPNCIGVSNFNDRVYCSAKSYNLVDNKLGDAYSKLRSTLTPSQRNRLKDVQSAWIKKRDEACAYDDNGAMVFKMDCATTKSLESLYFINAMIENPSTFDVILETYRNY